MRPEDGRRLQPGPLRRLEQGGIRAQEQEAEPLGGQPGLEGLVDVLQGHLLHRPGGSNLTPYSDGLNPVERTIPRSAVGAENQ